jgi:tRNA-2-methylthio-N6-dimethylallyladenosine synthase
MTYNLFVTGCQQNIYDSSHITHLLNKMGYVLASEKRADLIIVIGCSVRQKAVDRIWGKLKTWLKRKKVPQIIITGCLLPADKTKMLKRGIVFISSDKIYDTLPKLLNSSDQLTETSNQLINIKPVSSNRKQETNLVPIMYGCNNFCTYCAVPYTRGREVSRPEKDIIEEIKNLVQNNIKDVMLLGQNVNSYTRGPTRTKTRTYADNNSQHIPVFVRLLEKIEKISGLEKISFLTSHPKDMSDDLIDWMATSHKFSHELHLPLQSGDDEILRKMNRNYTSKHYLELINRLQSSVDSLRLTTDIIVGFPTETKKQFENTYNLCKQINFAGAFISQFSPRAGTPAAKMSDDVTRVEKKRRWEKLNSLINKKA